MHFSSFTQLSFEINHVLNAISKKDTFTIQLLKERYTKELSIPKKHILYKNGIQIFSPEISYHILSIYLLLDMIDSSWNGKQFIPYQFSSKQFLLSELKISSEYRPFVFNLSSFTKKIIRFEELIEEQLFIFLLPFKSQQKQFYVESAFPNHLLILYASDKTFEASLFEALSKIALRELYNDKLPKWTSSFDSFVSEVMLYCEGKPSHLKRKLK